MKLLLDSALTSEGGGGLAVGDETQADWKASLPAEIRDEPSLAQIKDVASLAKSYVHAQRLIGGEKILAPKDSWGDKEWSAFWNRIGRPEKPEGYEIKRPDNLDSTIQLDDGKINELKTLFHGIGLTNAQAGKLFGYFVHELNEDVKTRKASADKAMADAVRELRTEWGMDFDNNLQLAKGAVRALTDESFAQFLDSSGLGNHPQMAKLFLKLAKMTAEDRNRLGESSMTLSSSARAAAEIDSLVQNKEFMSDLMDARSTGHKLALQRWEKLHQMAYPGKVTGGV